jgi:hypothetical protein
MQIVHWTQSIAGVSVLVMRKRDRDSFDPHAVKPSRRSQLEALLFAGATLATTALTLGNVVDPKIPPFKGE